MNTQKLVLDSFYYEWMRLRRKLGEVRRRPSFLKALESRAGVESEVGAAVKETDSIFDFEAVGKSIDLDLQRFKGIEKRRRTRYHQMVLRFMGRLYAHQLFNITGGASPDREAMIEASRFIKNETGFSTYPLHRQP